VGIAQGYDENSEFFGIAENLYYKSQLVAEKSLSQFLIVVGYE